MPDTVIDDIGPNDAHTVGVRGSVDALCALEQRRLEAMRGNDVAALDQLLAPDMVYVHESGRVFGRDDYVRAVETHALTYNDDVTLAQEQVKLWPELMIAFGAMNGHALLNGERQVFNLRYTSVWLRSGDDWRLVLVQKTPIQPDALTST